MNNNYNNSSKKFSIGKIFKMFLVYIKNVVVDFFNSFRYNNMKLPAILIALPGILLGFFIVFHSPTINKLAFEYDKVYFDEKVTVSLNTDTEDPLDWKINIAELDYTSPTGKTGITNIDLVNLDINSSVDTSKTQLPSVDLTLANLSYKGEDNVLQTNNIDLKKDLIIIFEAPEGISYDSYTLYFYRLTKLDGIDEYFPVKVVTDLNSGDAIGISDLGSGNYYVGIQLIAAENDAQYRDSDVSTTLLELSSSYVGSDFVVDTYYEFAGNYGVANDIVIEGETIYKKDQVLYTLNADGSSKLVLGDKTYNPKFDFNRQIGSISSINAGATIKDEARLGIIPFDYTGIVLFILMLLGILNIFTALSVSGKKNLGSVLKATVSTIAMVVCAVLYIYAIIACSNAIDDGIVKITTELWTVETYASIGTVVAAVICSILGVILGFIFYDRTYEKVDR